ncbi:SCO3374 family protein [Streptomyces capillispiralis]|uniref:SCO3374 family protein n=1 Tax=Streptomyces capillispiralis TaxID=68182 RepID=UPI00368E2C8C
MVGTVPARVPPVPLPRHPLPPDEDGVRHGDEVRHWYENVLGWPTVPGEPVRLVVGVRFDVLDVPVAAGWAALARLGAGSGWGADPGADARADAGARCSGWGFPVAVRGGRMRFLVAAGSAEEVPGLLEWLEWGALELDLAVIGAGGSMEAPRRVVPEGAAAGGGAVGGTSSVGSRARRHPPGRDASQGAAVWLRPPEPGREVEASLPALSAMGTRSAPGDRGGPPDLVRLVNTVATQVHRVRLRRGCSATRTEGQPLAFS